MQKLILSNVRIISNKREQCKTNDRFLSIPIYNETTIEGKQHAQRYRIMCSEISDNVLRDIG